MNRREKCHYGRGEYENHIEGLVGLIELFGLLVLLVLLVVVRKWSLLYPVIPDIKSSPLQQNTPTNKATIQTNKTTQTHKTTPTVSFLRFPNHSNMSFLRTCITLALLALQLLAQGQEILGCADLNCPPLDQTTTFVNCTIADKSFGAIGVASIPINNHQLPRLTWTEGVNIHDRDGQRTFDKSFYLGTPPHIDFTGIGACAVFFNTVNATFKSGPRNDVSTGTCQDALGLNCVDAIIQRANNVNVTGLSSSAACTKLQAAFTNNTVDTACNT